MTSLWYINYNPTVRRWLKGFPARVALVVKESRSEQMVKQINRQYATVQRCVVRANNQKNAFYNLLLACEKLNNLLCSAEISIRDYRANAHMGHRPIDEEEND